MKQHDNTSLEAISYEIPKEKKHDTKNGALPWLLAGAATLPLLLAYRKKTRSKKEDAQKEQEIPEDAIYLPGEDQSPFEEQENAPETDATPVQVLPTSEDATQKNPENIEEMNNYQAEEKETLTSPVEEQEQTVTESTVAVTESPAPASDETSKKTKASRLARARRFLQKNEYSYLSYAFFIPVVLFYLIYLAMGLHPFGDGSVLVLDLNGQYVSFYEMLREAVFGDASLIYSFERALGGEFMGIYAYYLASPFSYIVALFPATRILEALLTIFLLKAGLCGITFGFYLHKSTKPESRNKITIVTFSILYAMSAYCVVQQHNSMWIDAVIWLPILTYAIEQLIKYGKFRLYVVILALTICSNFYIGYMVCIYVAAYTIYYYFANDHKFGSVHCLNNPRGETRHFRKTFVRIVFYSIVAVGMSAIIVFTAYYSLKLGKTSFSDPSWAFKLKFDFLDFLTKFLPGSYDTVRPEGLPFVYCGLLTVMLLPIYFCSKKFSRRERIASGLFISFFVLSFAISILDLIWHGFQRPNWLNYRYSFMLCFFLLILAYKAFGEIRKVSTKMLVAITSAIVAFVVIVQRLEFESYYKHEGEILAVETILFSLLCAAGYLVILAVARRTKQRESIALILAIVCCLEVYCSGLTCAVQFGKDVIYTKYSTYNDYMNDLRPVVEAIQKADHSFYRMEKTSMRKTNDSMGLDMNSLCCSTSTLNKETIDFLYYMGYASKSNWSKYLGGTPVNDSLLGLKYLISKKEMTTLYEEFPIDLGEEDLHEEDRNPYTVYLNPYALSVAYGVDAKVKDIVLSDYEKYDNPMERMNALVGAMLGSDEPVEIYQSIPVPDPTTHNCVVSTTGIYTKYATENTDTVATLTYELQAPMTENGEMTELFFFLGSDIYTREVSLKVNGNNAGSFGGNETNRIVSLGSFASGQKVRIVATIDNDLNNLYVKTGTDCVYFVNEEVFTDSFEKLLANPQYVVEDDCKNDHLIGTITTEREEQTILTTIPYDEGFTILLDGQPIEYEKTLDALITFEIRDPGEHKLEFVYRPKMLVYGTMVSCMMVAVFLILCVTEKKFRLKAWGKGGRTIGVSDTDEGATEDASLWSFSFNTYDPPEENENEAEASVKEPKQDEPAAPETTDTDPSDSSL